MGSYNPYSAELNKEVDYSEGEARNAALRAGNDQYAGITYALLAISQSVRYAAERLVEARRGRDDAER